MRGLFIQVFTIILFTILLSFLSNQFMGMRIFSLAFPEQAALFDFEFEDFIFSVKESKTEVDTNIVLINIGLLSRAEIAQQINIISRYKPKVIGMNVIFGCPFEDCSQRSDTVDNKSLSEAIKTAGNVVLSSKLWSSKVNSSGQYDSLEVSEPLFSDYSRNGFTNLYVQDDFRIRTVRKFMPRVYIKGLPVNSLGVEIAWIADSAKTKRFLSRNKDSELINYQGNIAVKGAHEDTTPNYFNLIDYSELQSGRFDSTLIRDKVVLMGFLGEIIEVRYYEDMFYSPLNRTQFGRALPDMYGLVVQANIISMILNEDYIDSISDMNAWIVSLLIIALNVIFFIWLHHRNSPWYEPLSLIVPGVQIIIIAYLRYFLFIHFNYIVDLSHATVMLVSVSLSSGLYFGPFQLALQKIEKLSFRK